VGDRSAVFGVHALACQILACLSPKHAKALVITHNFSPSQRDGNPLAQGCEFASYPGLMRTEIVNPNGVASFSSLATDATPMGLRILLACIPRVARGLATPG
jgi:hypothetical protein